LPKEEGQMFSAVLGNFTGHYSGFAATTVLFQVLQFPIHIIRRFLEDSGKHLSFFFWQLIVLLSIYGAKINQLINPLC
jgi:hypothetical protein